MEGGRRLTHEQRLAIISKAWGRQRGYCFFPAISGGATTREERIRSYEEGPAFLWPRDRDKILARMSARADDDLYWCPSLFERGRRSMELAMDEHALWADLDEVDPHTIDDYPPTVAWETSPGRYQALWVVSSGDLQGASWQGGENQRLTYHLGADSGGWDTTQLLRLPDWPNHKPEHRGGTKDGPNPDLDDPPMGKLLWKSGRKYLPDDFDDLPEVPRTGEFEDILEDQIEAVDAKAVWGRVRLKLPAKARELFSAREALGDRSERLWWLMRCLADVGCTAVEIVALVRETAWNKFAGRGDELKRLTIEAGKAIAARSPAIDKAIAEEREERPRPILLADALRSVQPPRWLVEGVWTDGACGFIAGQPKSFKTWCALDLALSVASGTPFLDSFRVVRPGPVLYLQEEDGLPMVKARYDKVWPAKRADRMIVENGEVVWLPPQDMSEPNVMACIGYGFVLSDPGWQAWLDEVLTEGFPRSEADGGGREPYRLVVMDPLMMISGDVDENRSTEMTERVFKPAKQLARKHGHALAIVHHMRKASGNDRSGAVVRGGQLMLGSVANHAWAEDALYVKLAKGGVHVELESKSAPSSQFEVRGLRNRAWTPRPTKVRSSVEGEDDRSERQDARGSAGSRTPSDDDPSGEPNGRSGGRGSGRGGRRRGRPEAPAISALRSLGPGGHTVQDVSAVLQAQDRPAGRSTVYQQLQRALARGLVARSGVQWTIAEQNPAPDKEASSEAGL